MRNSNTDETRLRTLGEKRAMPKAEQDEMMSLLEHSDCPTAAAWRMRNEQIEANVKRTQDQLSRQGKMTPERKRYLALSSKYLCDMTEAEFEELHRLDKNSNCPEAKHSREQTRAMLESVNRRCKENKERLKAAGLPTFAEMTDDEKRISTLFRTTPAEVEEYIVTMRNHRRGLSVLPEHELKDIRTDADEARAQKNRMREAQKIRTEEQAEQKHELDEFIRKKYRSKSQSLKSGEMQVKEVNAAIIDMVKARFTDDHGHGLVISQSRIDRAMGKKK